MKKITHFLFLFILISNFSFAQTTEDFETETTGSRSFTNNGQVFNITSTSPGDLYNIELFNGAGWNGSGADNKFIDNKSQYIENDGTNFTIKTNNTNYFTVKELYLFCSRKTLSAHTGTLTIIGKKDGNTTPVFTITKTNGFADVKPNFTPSNGYTHINFVSEGGVDNSNKIIDELVFSGTGNLDYLGLDAFKWDAVVANTVPVIGGTSAGQTVNDNATLTPFSSITTSDADGDNLSATITLDDNAKGVLTGTSLTGSGPYVIASTSPLDLQAKLRALSFNPTDNRTSTSEITTFTVAVNDSADTTTDNTTTVISSAVAPIINGVSSFTSNGTYGTGNDIIISVIFSENVTVSGTPQLTLETGTIDRTINYNGTGSGSNTLFFTYTVQAGDESADLDYTAINSLTAGTSIQDAGGSNATLTLASPGAANSLGANTAIAIDGIAPGITSITRQSPTTSATNADALAWDVTFDSAVVNVSENDFSVNGTTASIASVTNPNGNVYRVTTSGGNLASLNATVTLVFASGQNITDASSNVLTNLTPTGTNNNTFVLDNTNPLISSITRQSPTTSPTNADALVWDVTFDSAVVNVSADDFSVNGTTASIASVTNPSGNVYRVTTSGGNLASLNATVTLAFASGQNITDIVGNVLTNLTSTGTNNNTFVVDNAGPTLTSSNPTDDSTGVVLNQNITLTFNENISKGTGYIFIRQTSDDRSFEVIDVTTAAVTVETNTVTINLSSDFDLNTGYYIQISNTAFKDALGNNYAGIALTDATSLNFTTQANQTNLFIPAFGVWSVLSNWSLGRLPISTDNVDVATKIIFLDKTNVTVNDLSISIGGVLYIVEGYSITINGNLNQNGELTILSNWGTNGSLILKGNHTGISNVNYKRDLSANWHLISAPISGINISSHSGKVNTSGNKYAIAPYVNNVVSASRWNYYTGATGIGTGANPLTTAGTYTAGKGYSIQKSTAGNLIFSGTLNTTDKTYPITDGGDNPAGNRWNLVGNPYTAPLSGSNTADATNNFLKVNIDAENLDPSRAGLYLWDGTNYVEKSVDDAAFYIAPGQGFFVHAPDAGGTYVSFTEDMQNHHSGDIFLKSGTSYPEIILQLTDGTKNSSTKIRYIENKTIGLDPGSDIGTFTGVSSNFNIFTHLPSNSNGVNFAIQALPNANYEDMVVPVGVIAKSQEVLTFSIEGLNLPENINVFLEDRVNNKFINLTEKDYKITLEEDSKDIGQFYIHTTYNKSLSVKDNLSLENVSVYKTNNSNLRLTGLPLGNTNLTIYNILGKQVKQTSFNSTGVKDISLPQLSKGIYLVKLETENGKLNKKIILE
ncbi:hypothetical protein CW731_11835 [Polaribacter sp. ALD11]|uniref:Ig-like domain-containing protein n=1 Tax=Polaribacter sp. ALD11 TaxID=2058137 RepID=UPI000C309807|nr:Ig-like domain-containing protein [Polaribacter sp. ALD11]AUC85937.1 hypothetical protein CW731_11835 [Polaribacter sp. ALD11]